MDNFIEVINIMIMNLKTTSLTKNPITSSNLSGLDKLNDYICGRTGMMDVTIIKEIVNEIISKLQQLQNESNTYTALKILCTRKYSYAYGVKNGYTHFNILLTSNVQLIVSLLSDGPTYILVKEGRILLNRLSGGRSSNDGVEMVFPKIETSNDRMSFIDTNTTITPSSNQSCISKSEFGLIMLTSKQVRYLKCFNDKFVNTCFGYSRRDIINTTNNHIWDFTSIMGVFETLGMSMKVGGRYHFNIDLIKAVYSKLESVNFEGVHAIHPNHLFSCMEKTYINKYIPYIKINSALKQLNNSPEGGYFEVFSMKDPNTSSSRLRKYVRLTPKGINIVDVWIDIYKLIEPYSKRTLNSQD